MELSGEPPIGGISGREAAEILGIHELGVSRLVSRRILRKAVPHRRIGLDRADVEQLALERYAHRTTRTGRRRAVRPRSSA
jgi:hypothetical protein